MNKQQPNAKNGALSFLIGFLICQLSVLAVSFLAVIFASFAGIPTDSLTTFFSTALGYMLSAIALNIGLLVVFFQFNKKTQNQIISKPTLNKSAIYILVAIAAFVLLYPITTSLDKLFTNLNVEVNIIPYEINTKNYLISLISLVLFPAICEELLFRGFIFKSLKPYGKVFSVVLTAVMFALYHMAIDQFIYPLLMGLLLSYVMHKENNIIYPIIIHFLNNFLSLTLAYLNISLIFNHWTYILIAILFVAIFIGIFAFFVLKEKQTTQNKKLDHNDKFYLTICLAGILVIWIIVNIFKIL